jgi:hypothetical protein
VASVGGGVAVSELVGVEVSEVGDVGTGVSLVAGAVVGVVGGAVVVTAAVTGGALTRRLRHSPWLPEVSTAQTCSKTLTLRRGQATVALVSAV